MVSKEVSQLLTKLRSQGFSVERTNSSHWKVRAPNGESAFLPSTPGKSNRSMKNVYAKLRRIGANV